MGVRFKQQGGPPGVEPTFDFSDDFSTDRDRQLYQTLGYGDSPAGIRLDITGGLMRITGGATSGQLGFICTGAKDLQGEANQYIQAQLVSAPDANVRTGIACKVSGMGIAGAAACEEFATFTHVFTGTLNVLGCYPTVNAYAIALAVGAPAINDIFELFVECGSASNRVRFWQNGVLLADVLDADANRVVAEYGYPGWAGSGSGIAATIDWDNLIVSNERP